MFKLNCWQLVAAVTIILFATMILTRLGYIATASETTAVKIRGRNNSSFFEFTFQHKRYEFEADEFTQGPFILNWKYPVLFDADNPEKACVKNFSGIWSKHIFWYSIIAFAWIMGGSSILAHNEELLIGKGWLKSRKNKAAGASCNLPAVRKKSRNFKND